MATPEGFEIIDLASRNGTFVDGVRVKRQQLRDGAVLFFGGCTAVFRLLSDKAVAAVTSDLHEPFGPVPTASPRMADAIRRMRRFAPTSDTDFLTGETGTGKEVYARAIHRASGRQGKFVALNCAAIPTELVESELFGYARGAHSQASQAKRGLIEQADGGTLFLDEIGDMPRAAQAKLLRFLQEREVLPLGSAQTRPVDVRVIAATAQIETDHGGPTLRKDLLMRLGSQPIVLPPLRERPEDIGILAHHFLGSPGRAFDNSAFLALCLHDWTGNVRELEKVIREAILLSEADVPIGLEHLPSSLAGRLHAAAPEDGQRRRSPRPAPERDELKRLLEAHGGRVADVARLLDCHWSVVWRWLKRCDLDPAGFRSQR
jgi:two-component system response regulator GlrR